MLPANENRSVATLVKSIKILRYVFFGSLIAGVLLCMICIKLPSYQTEEVPIEYMPFSADIKTNTNCTVALTEDDIIAVIPTSVSLKSNGNTFVSVTVNYHLVNNSEGDSFYIQTTGESSSSLNKITRVESMYEGDFFKALSNTGGRETVFYGKTVSAPDLSAESSILSTENPAEAELAESLLREYPIVSVRSLTPETETVRTGVGPGKIFSYIGAALLGLAILSVIARRFVLNKLNALASSQYLN